MDQLLKDYQGTDSSFYDAQYKNIYKQQFGGDIDPYEGYRFQYSSRNLRGNGIWSTIKGGIMPILKSLLPYLGSTAASAATGFVDEIKSGKSFKEAAKRQLKKSAKGIALDVAERLDQDGSGVKKRRRRKKRRCSNSKLKPKIVKLRPKKKTKKKKIIRRRMTRSKKSKNQTKYLF